MEIGVRESFKNKLVRSTWAGHVEKMGDEKLTKIANIQNQAVGYWSFVPHHPNFGAMAPLCLRHCCNIQLLLLRG